MAIGVAQPHSKSYSFPLFHADEIPYSAAPVACPDMPCEQVCVRNSVNSAGNAVIGSNILTNTRGIILEPGNWSPWIPVQNLSLIWHMELTAGTVLQYMIIR